MRNGDYRWLAVGWVAGNRFAEVLPEDLPALAARTLIEGAKRLVLRRGRE